MVLDPVGIHHAYDQKTGAFDPEGVVAKAAAESDLARVLGSGPAPINRFSLLQDGGGIGRIEWRLKAMTVDVPSTRAPGVGVSAQVPPHQRGDGL